MDNLLTAAIVFFALENIAEKFTNKLAKCAETAVKKLCQIV